MPAAETTLSYTFRARMLNPYGAPGNLVGIMFHSSTHNRQPAYGEVVFSPTGVAKINLFYDGAKHTIRTAAYGGRRNAWFDVKFELTSLTSFSVSVDGVTLFRDISTYPLFEGGFGLITHWAPGKFDDVWYDQRVLQPFSEKFNGALRSDWVHSGAWNTNGGTLKNTSAGISDIVTTYCGCWDTDFVYRARLLNQYGAAGNLVGLVYNYQRSGLPDDPGFYAGDYYEVVFSPTGAAYLNKIIQGAKYRVATGAHTIPRNVWFNVEVFRSGAYTTVKVNGATIFNAAPQGQLGRGDIGVVTHWANGRFDNLSIADNVLR